MSRAKRNDLPKSVYRDKKFFYYIRLVVFVSLMVVEGVVFFANFNKEKLFGLPLWLFILSIEVVFTVSNVLKTFVFKEFKHKIACYVVDFLSQLILTFLIRSDYLCIIYILILTEFYMSASNLRSSVVMGIVSLVSYVATYAVSVYHFNVAELIDVITSCFTELLIITLHFFIVNYALSVYDSRQRLAKSYEELNKSKRKLQKAYDELAEVTALQERQRIAKDIHDTAGHSITTVIMQTEAAKLIVEEDPQEAKRKIIAANLQAKNALEELRESVHLLAGDAEKVSLKSSLERIIHDSCDGTDIVVRYDIEDVFCSSAKRRFICNTLKEGISNGLRHGHATAFYFEFSKTDEGLKFLLSDNGKGADMGTFKTGFGMRSMRSRAESFGGKIHFGSAPDEGFEIEMELPADEKK